MTILTRQAEGLDATLGGSGDNPNGDRILKKGSEFHRYASKNEPVDSYRKYVSFADDDDKIYKRFAKNGTLYSDGPVYRYTYEAAKDVRIKNPKEQLAELLDKYKDRSVNELLDELSNNEFYDTPMHLVDDIKVGELSTEAKDDPESTELLYEVITEIVLMDFDNISKDLQNKGYDAMYDLEDMFLEDIQHPLILLNPESSVKMTEYSKVHRWWPF